ncbi:MAG: tetratricopeptide repeat protein [Bacteroidales bacterium]|nr:tetratricopeptide repeat protein [Bacteroidales bacterium]
MKRIVSILMVLAMVFGLVAFQCSSTEITSAKLYIQQKNLPKAKDALLKEVEKNPKSDEGFYLLGYIYGEEGNIDKMLESFDASLAISKKFEQNIEDSKKYHWSNNFNKGVGFFNRATKATAEDTTKMFFDQSIAAFESAILCQPDSVSTYQNLVFSYYNAGRPMDAVKPLEKIIELIKSADSYAMLGEIYYNKGIEYINKYTESKVAADSTTGMEFFHKAIKVLEDGRKNHPDNPEILMILSNAYINADELETAMDTFKAGIEKEPLNKVYRYNYGVLLLGADKFEEAATQFEKAIEIDPAYENAFYNLGVTYVKWGTKLREANIEDENNKEYLEKFKLSLTPLNKYLEMKPEEAKVWELLGKVYANLAMTAESKAAFEKADLYR